MSHNNYRHGGHAGLKIIAGLVLLAAAAIGYVYTGILLILFLGALILTILAGINYLVRAIALGSWGNETWEEYAERKGILK
jgi:hypothetical protein